MFRTPAAAALVAAMLSTASAAADTPATTENVIRVRLKGGQELRGRLVERSETAVVLELPSGGRIGLDLTAIAAMDEEERAEVHGSEIWHEDRNRTRYLYAPSGFMLRQGEAYFGQKELFFSSVAFGLTDHVTLLLGSVIPANFVRDGQNVIGALKVGGSATDWLHLAAGAETFVLPSTGSAGFVFGAATFGTPNAHFTIAAGPPFAFTSSTSEVGNVIVVASANLRVSRSLALVTENWFVPVKHVGRASDLRTVNGLALRYVGERAGVDIGFLLTQDAAYPIPWLDFTWNFELAPLARR